MSIVRMGSDYKICATCDFWGGPRTLEDDCSVFNNRDTGKCGGKLFHNMKVGSISTCTKWSHWVDLKVRNDDLYAVK